MRMKQNDFYLQKPLDHEQEYKYVYSCTCKTYTTTVF